MSFEFYEVVSIKAEASIPEIRGFKGYVAGKSTSEEGDINYLAVYLYEAQECFFLEEGDVETLGYIDEVERAYKKTSIRVSADPETGEGTLIE